MKNKKQKTRSRSRGNSLAWFFGSLSFIADAITIMQLFNKIPNFQFITPYAGLVILILALFTYLALLHRHWEGLKEMGEYSDRFTTYILVDLLYNFRQPFYLLPLLIFILLLFPILFALDYTSYFLIQMFFFMGVLVFIFIKLVGLTYNVSDPTSVGRKLTDDTKAKIVSEWTDWEQRITLEFSRRSVLEESDFNDIAKVSDYGYKEFEFIFALYASKHPENVRYGTLWEKTQTDIPEKNAENCLVEISWLDEHKQFFMSS